MPQKKQKSNPFKGYVAYNLSTEQKQALKAMELPADYIDNMVTKLIDSGYSVKFGWDDYNRCVLCVLAHTDPDHEDYGWMLSGRGSSLAKALRQALYIDHVIGSQWSGWMSDSKRAFEEYDD